MMRPSEIRTIFGNNLRTLSKDFSSITVLANNLGINRTQFNRYLSGESFPRPDVLAIICEFFINDGGVLSDDIFPSGFFRFSRRSFIDHDLYVVGLVYIFRSAGNTYLRGYETTSAMRIQNLPVKPEYREFRGLVLKQEEGIAFQASRMNTMTTSFNYLNRVTSFHNNFWLGYTARTVPETAAGVRATRLVYEHLPQTTASVLNAARNRGFYSVDQLEPFHRRLLRPDDPFS